MSIETQGGMLICKGYAVEVTDEITAEIERLQRLAALADERAKLLHFAGDNDLFLSDRDWLARYDAIAAEKAGTA